MRRGSSVKDTSSTKVTDWSGKKLTVLDEAIHLKMSPTVDTLKLGNNSLQSLPWVVISVSFPSLRFLFISKNGLTSIPDEIGLLVNLERLDLSLNQIKSVGDKFASLHKLRKLDLSGNQLDTVPDPISKLTALEVLNMAKNFIHSLPTQLADLEKLVSIEVTGNPLISPPSQVINKGCRATLAYLRNLSSTFGAPVHKFRPHRSCDPYSSLSTSPNLFAPEVSKKSPKNLFYAPHTLPSENSPRTYFFVTHSVFADQGCREYMEDRHTVLNHVRLDPLPLRIKKSRNVTTGKSFGEDSEATDTSTSTHDPSPSEGSNPSNGASLLDSSHSSKFYSDHARLHSSQEVKGEHDGASSASRDPTPVPGSLYHSGVVEAELPTTKEPRGTKVSRATSEDVPSPSRAAKNKRSHQNDSSKDSAPAVTSTEAQESTSTELQESRVNGKPSKESKSTTPEDTKNTDSNGASSEEPTAAEPTAIPNKTRKRRSQPKNSLREVQSRNGKTGSSSILSISPSHSKSKMPKDVVEDSANTSSSSTASSSTAANVSALPPSLNPRETPAVLRSKSTSKFLVTSSSPASMQPNHSDSNIQQSGSQEQLFADAKFETRLRPCLRASDGLRVSEGAKAQARIGDDSLDDTDGLSIAFFAVYDGHAGGRCSEYLKYHLHQQLFEQKEVRAGEVPLGLYKTFIKTEKHYCQVAKQQIWNDGSTAVVIVIHGDNLVAAHAGDSRAVLCRGKKAYALTVDHKPDRPDEEKRILAVGGSVVNNTTTGWVPRVNGHLAVSRSFGDLRMKDPSPVVSAEPEITVVPLTPNDQFAILASDGLWDVLSNQDAVDIVRKYSDKNKAAEHLVRKALKLGTSDNVTAVIVWFTWAHDSGIERVGRENPI